MDTLKKCIQSPLLSLKICQRNKYANACTQRKMENSLIVIVVVVKSFSLVPWMVNRAAPAVNVAQRPFLFTTSKLFF